MAEDLRVLFTEWGIEVESDEVLLGLKELADDLHKTSTELVENFQVFRFNNKLVQVDTLSAAVLEKFKTQLFKDQAKENVKLQSNLGFTHDFDSFITEPKTPVTKSFQQKDVLTPTPQSIVYTPASNFAKRQKKGEVIDKINSDLIPTFDGGRQHSISGSRNITILSEEGRGGGYMINGIQKQQDVVNERIERFLQEWIDRKEVEVVLPVNTATLEDVAFVGRICCDGEGMLNEASILLEGSVDLCSGARVRLNVSNVQQYRVFPGQIVGIIGTNPTGKQIFAKQIKEYMFPKCRYSEKLSVTKEDVRMVACAGPYTCQQDLAFEPLDEILAHCRSEAPTVLILMGPFLDENHPLIAAQDVDEIFQQQVVNKIQQFCANSGMTRIVLVPSCKDIFHHPVYPTPAFPADYFRGIPNVTLVRDPCVIGYGGVSIALTSLDVLRTMCKAQIQKGYNVTDTLLYTTAHLIGQSSFYPLVPHEVGQNVDLSLSQHYEMSKQADILLLASDLQCFTRQLQVEDRKTICVNTGRLCKGQGGSYTEILVSSQETKKGKPIWDSCKVEIKRV